MKAVVGDKNGGERLGAGLLREAGRLRHGEGGACADRAPWSKAGHSMAFLKNHSEVKVQCFLGGDGPEGNDVVILSRKISWNRGSA